MLSTKHILMATIALALTSTTHAQVCVQCPTFDNIGRRLAGTTPLVPNAGICCLYGGLPLICCYNPASALEYDGSGNCPGQADPVNHSCVINNADQ